MNFIEELRDINVPETIIEKIHRHFAGSPIYVPKVKPDLIKRNAEIYRRFNGKNHKDLAREFGLCYQQISKILSQRKLDGA